MHNERKCFVTSLLNIARLRSHRLPTEGQISIAPIQNPAPTTQDPDQEFRLAAIVEPVDVDALCPFGLEAGIAVDVVVELVELGLVSAGVALTSPALKQRLKSLVLLPICVMVAIVCVWAYSLHFLMSPS